MATVIMKPGIQRLIARAPIVGHALGRRAGLAAAGAKRIARSEAYDTGAYHDSIGVEVGIDERTGEQAAVVRATDWKAGLIEFGTSERRAKAPLRRGADAAGLRLTGRFGRQEAGE